jgi:subtilisin-like proprotein convertase family protein
VPQSASGGTCDIYQRFVSCLQGGIASGGSKTVTITALVTGTADVSNTVTITTSENDTSGANIFSVMTDVTGSTETFSYSTGNIATPIPDLSTVDIPISVPDAKLILDVRARVRLNHTFDGDLDIRLISPTGVEVKLSERHGGGGANYGSGTNDCSGTFTEFRADAATPIASGAPPYAGSFRPDGYVGDFAGDQSNGTWKLRISDRQGADVGVVGCVQLDIVHAK